MRHKNGSFFREIPKAKRILSFDEYIQETMVIAKRIEKHDGGQRYTSAQLEIALVCFCDFEALKQEMDEDIVVVFPLLNIDYRAGFDWLDLSVSHRDEDAIRYFQERLQEPTFAKNYLHYKHLVRPDCALQKYETHSFEAIEAIINLDNTITSRP
ncbi:hypothetical protein [Legionella saoudiensis]|uniref:hypothetical protein n=1 Tax=Legionella saoudiensis TaxID=1750561 RepID=UPI00098EB559|nr:hypothetical protein [Legionella saoudiensis]